MAKASGNTRKIKPRSEEEKAIARIIKEHNYDTTWEITSVNLENGGYVATEKERIEYAHKSSNETKKYEKEKGMCIDLAHMGFQIEHLSEISGVSSPDVNIVQSPKGSIVKINGEYADLKSLSSHNNILRHGKDAIERQGGAKVVFKFPQSIDRKKMNMEINKLKERNIHGIYYFEGANTYKDF